MRAPEHPNPIQALPDNMQTIMRHQDVERTLSSQLQLNNTTAGRNIPQALATQYWVDDGYPMGTSASIGGATPGAESVARGPPEPEMGSAGGMGQVYRATTPADPPPPLQSRPIWPSTSEVAAEYRDILGAQQGQGTSSNGSVHGTPATPPPVVGSTSSVTGAEGMPGTGYSVPYHTGASCPGNQEHQHDNTALAESHVDYLDTESSDSNGLNQSHH